MKALKFFNKRANTYQLHISLGCIRGEVEGLEIAGAVCQDCTDRLVERLSPKERELLLDNIVGRLSKDELKVLGEVIGSLLQQTL